MNYEGVKILVEQGYLSDVDIPYYVKKLRRLHAKQQLESITFCLTDAAVILRYRFKNIPLERIWRISTSEVAQTKAI